MSAAKSKRRVKSKKCSQAISSYDDESDKFALMKIYLFIDATVKLSMAEERLSYVALEHIPELSLRASTVFPWM